jgi:hypothetical protein
MKHLKTFESFSYTNDEAIKEEFFGFGKPKDGEWSKDINTNWASLQAGKLSKESLKKKFIDWAESFGFDEKQSLAYGAKFATTVYDYIYKNADSKTVNEEEFAKIHFNRCKTVKKEGDKWVDKTAVGDGEGGPGGRKF